MKENRGGWATFAAQRTQECQLGYPAFFRFLTCTPLCVHTTAPPYEGLLVPSADEEAEPSIQDCKQDMMNVR